MFNDERTYESPISETLTTRWEGEIATSIEGGPTFNGMNSEEEW